MRSLVARVWLLLAFRKEYDDILAYLMELNIPTYDRLWINNRSGACVRANNYSLL